MQLRSIDIAMINAVHDPIAGSSSQCANHQRLHGSPYPGPLCLDHDIVFDKPERKKYEKCKPYRDEERMRYIFHGKVRDHREKAACRMTQSINSGVARLEKKGNGTYR